jgi:cytosine/creatinine deaminase
LRILDVGLHVGHMLSDTHLSQALEFITSNGAKNLGISDRYGIEEGKPANCIVLDCSTDKEAVQCLACSGPSTSPRSSGRWSSRYA